MRLGHIEQKQTLWKLFIFGRLEDRKKKSWMIQEDTARFDLKHDFAKFRKKELEEALGWSQGSSARRKETPRSLLVHANYKTKPNVQKDRLVPCTVWRYKSTLSFCKCKLRLELNLTISIVNKYREGTLSRECLAGWNRSEVKLEQRNSSSLVTKERLDFLTACRTEDTC